MLTRIRHRWLVMPGLIAGLALGVNHEPRAQGDDARVYAVLLRELAHAAPIPHPLRFVSTSAESPINPYMRQPEPRPPLDLSIPGVHAGTLAAFERVYDDTTSLAAALPHARVWRVREAAYGTSESWMRRLMLAPLYTFSRIGYNADRTQALVYAGYRCGGMCGDGNIVLVEKRDGRWRIVDDERVWIS